MLGPQTHDDGACSGLGHFQSGFELLDVKLELAYERSFYHLELGGKANESYKFLLETARATMRWAREVSMKVNYGNGDDELPDTIDEDTCATCLQNNPSGSKQCINPNCGLAMPVLPVGSASMESTASAGDPDAEPSADASKSADPEEDDTMRHGVWADHPGETPPDFALRPPGPTQRADWAMVMANEVTTLNSRENESLFQRAFKTLSKQNTELLAGMKLTKLDAQAIWDHLGIHVPTSSITVTKDLFKTPGEYFYTPLLVGWKKKENVDDAVDSGAAVNISNLQIPDQTGQPLSPDFAKTDLVRGVIGTSTFGAAMILRDCLRNCHNITAGKKGVYFEDLDGERKSSCLTYCAYQPTGPLLPHNPGALTTCVIEIVAAKEHVRHHKGQCICLEQHVCVTGIYQHLYPATELFTLGQLGWIHVHQSFFDWYPKINDYMESDAYPAKLNDYRSYMAQLHGGTQEAPADGSLVANPLMQGR